MQGIDRPDGAPEVLADHERIRWLEEPTRDFPFYRGVPVRLTGGQWLFVMAGVALGCAVLLGQFSIFAHGLWRLVPGLLFVAVPLAALARAAGRAWTALFRRVGWRDIGWMFVFALLNWFGTLLLGLVVVRFIGAQKNPGVDAMATSAGSDQFLFFLNSVPQLIGEEVFTILPFLALMHLFATRLAMPRRNAMMWAWLLTALLFGLIHLPTYHWNFAQCIVLIGGARLILSLAYIKTKNLWVSAGAHIINDWATFALAVWGASTIA